VTYNLDFKVTIIQCQITHKQYKIKPYLQRRTNRKVVHDLPSGAIFYKTLTSVSFQSHVIFEADYLRIQGLTHALLKSVISNNLE